MPSRYLIYALQDPLSWELRYVGRSSWGLRRARQKHDFAYCGNWVRWLERRGHQPIAVVLQEFPETTDLNNVLNEAEIYWIAELRRRGCPLTNCTEGGGGTRGYRRRDNAKRNATKNKARIWTPEQRQKLRLAVLGRKDSAETRAKKAKTWLGRRHTPESRAKMAEATVRQFSEPSARERLSAAARGKRHSPESKEKNRIAHLGRRHTPEALAKMSTAHLGHEVSVETRAKVGAAHRGKAISEDMRTKLREAWSLKREWRRERLREAWRLHKEEGLEKLRKLREAKKVQQLQDPVTEETGTG